MSHLTIRQQYKSLVSKAIEIRVHIDYKETIRFHDQQEKSVQISPGKHTIIIEAGMRSEKSMTKVLSTHPLYPLITSFNPSRDTITINADETQIYEIHRISHLKESLYPTAMMFGTFLILFPLAIYLAVKILAFISSPLMSFLAFLFYIIVLFMALRYLLQPLESKLNTRIEKPSFELRRIS